MKVLWFVQSNFDPSREKGGYNGAGWISSLRNEIVKKEGIDLALAFFSNESKQGTANGVRFYSMPTPILSSLKKIRFRLKKQYSKEEEALWANYRAEMLKVLDDFKPDVIQIFGSENKYGLVASVTKIPIVLHIQGIVRPCLNAYLPPFFSWDKSLRLATVLQKTQKENWESLEYCEKEVFRHVKNYIGRTLWDKRIIQVLSPDCNYYWGSEILRDTFYDSSVKRSIPQKLTIVSTISIPLYKGYDMILKTASLLKECYHIDFEWKVIGNVQPSLVEKSIGINHQDVNVTLLGVLNAEQLKHELLNSTLYFHPSYIDNSPNSVCEAQMLGISCIGTNVGGVSSIIEDGKTGFLVPANDPIQATFLIKQIFDDSTQNLQVGINAQKIAKKRHDKQHIVDSLVDLYKHLIGK
ncbi:glycosyltransferase [Prevotella copri]|uniref:Glycosyltransferase n=1 Tax=Segatella copri TaxID=165179 RepID=A0AA90VF64_9BACT|nr:glycosyltransferase [Segatella copri]MQO09599.1 glycosyltransferase [Segatella copri]